MSTIKRFEDMELWQKARLIENKVFQLIQSGPLSKDYATRDQMNRAVGSIMDNIAEGFGRGSRLEFIQFLTISRGSASELQSQLFRCLDRKYISKVQFDELMKNINEIGKMLTGFINYLNKTSIKGNKFKSRE
jgi:four helix bundle protein